MLLRIIGCVAVLWGCGSHRITEEPWTVRVAPLLRGQLDLGGDRVPVDEGLLSRFYLQRDDRPAWCGPTGPKSQADALVLMLARAKEDGLREQDYALEKIRAEIAHWRVPGAQPDLRRLLGLDVLLTRAFLAYAGHLQRGRIDPRTIHPEWNAPVQSADLIGLLQTALDLQQVGSALERLRPPQAGYNHLRQALRGYRSLAARGGWPLLETGADTILVRRLREMGDLPVGIDTPDRGQLSAAIAHYQERHGLAVHGRLDGQTLAELNRPVEERLAAIELNLERWRWLPHDPGTRYILVRIADYELDAVEGGKTVLNMRVIVGKPFWRTPVFSAKLTRMVFNPHWYIPRSIAVKEILPQVKRDPDYLQRRNIIVTSGMGLQLSPVDPDSIVWSGLSVDDFEYSFTQAPGEGNPLGRIKFIFPNPYNVYLHDTPHTQLFAERDRAFSHGCIRLEKSAELAEHILRGQGHWPLARVERELASGINRGVVLVRPLPVYLLYWTTWVDEEGLLQFRRDEYDADYLLRQALRHR